MGRIIDKRLECEKEGTRKEIREKCRVKDFKLFLTYCNC